MMRTSCSQGLSSRYEMISRASFHPLCMSTLSTASIGRVLGAGKEFHGFFFLATMKRCCLVGGLCFLVRNIQHCFSHNEADTTNCDVFLHYIPVVEYWR